MFDAFLRSEIQRLDLPGLAVAITQQGQERFATGYGYCDKACNNPITADTLFGVASVTKLVTAIETMRLQDQQQLSVHDPVKLYYPDLKVASDTRMQLRHLLSHSTGLPGLPGRFFALNLQNEGDSSGGVDNAKSKSANTKLPSDTTLRNATDLADFINKLNVAVLAPPGALLNYSNESFCLLGGIIEKLTAETYQQRITNSIFKPLNMAHSLVGYNTQHSGNIALPLVCDKSKLREVGIWDAPLFYAVGGILSSARDLTRLLSVLADDSHFLSSESRQALRTPTGAVASRPDTSIGYGYGLEVQTLDGNSTLYWHTGQRAGISSFVAWVSGADIAVSVLSHIGNAPVAGIGFELINKLLNRTDVVWPQLSNRITARPDIGSLVAINQFQGRYLSGEGFERQVKIIGTDLFLINNNPTTHEAFRFIDKQSGIVGNQNFRFLMPEETGFEFCALALDLRVLLQAE